MVTYEFRCGNCGELSTSEYHYDEQPCPHCNSGIARRVWGNFSVGTVPGAHNATHKEDRRAKWGRK